MGQLFPDRVLLFLDLMDISRAQAIARDFRCCTRSLMIGPTLYACGGLPLVRSMFILGMSTIVLDLRACGTPWELWSLLSSVFAHSEVSAATVIVECGKAALTRSLEAANGAAHHLGLVARPKVIGCLPIIWNEQWGASQNGVTPEARQEYLTRVADLCLQTGIDGLLVDYADLTFLHEKYATLPLLCHIKRELPHGYVTVPAQQRALPGVNACLRAGATHAIYDASKLKLADVEETAETLRLGLREGHALDL